MCLPAVSQQTTYPLRLQINYENRRLRGKDQQLSCHVASPPLNQATWDSLDFTVSCCTLGASSVPSLCKARSLLNWDYKLAALHTFSSVWACKAPCTCLARSHQFRVS